MSTAYATTEQHDPARVPLDDILTAVEGAQYPVEKENLANLAERHDAPDPVVRAIRLLPKDRLDSEADLRRAHQELQATQDERSTPTGRGNGDREMRDQEGTASPRTPKPRDVEGSPERGSRSPEG